MDTVKLPEIVCARDSSIHEMVRKPISQRLAEATSRKLAAEGMSEESEPDHEVDAHTHTHTHIYIYI